MGVHEQQRALILVVDDEPSITNLVRRVLESEQHRVVVANNGLQALELVAGQPPDLIMLDIDMPGLGGLEVCRMLKDSPATRLTPILFLTGTGAADARVRAWNSGADEFLTKPFHTLDLTTRCRSLLRQKSLVDALESAESVMFALTRTLEAKSPYTHGHSDRVTKYALALGAESGLDSEDLEILRRGSFLHDIGKISTPDDILNKPGPLTPGEFDVIKRHPADGVRIVEQLRSARDLLPLIRSHHERLDGNGYPEGLMGENIPSLVRILSVADVYDALTSERPYRPAMPREDCRKIMVRNAEQGGLDPSLVALFFGAALGSMAV